MRLDSDMATRFREYAATETLTTTDGRADYRSSCRLLRGLLGKAADAIETREDLLAAKATEVELLNRDNDRLNRWWAERYAELADVHAAAQRRIAELERALASEGETK